MRSPASAFLNQHSYLVVALVVLVVLGTASSRFRPRLRLALVGAGLLAFTGAFAALFIGSGDVRAPTDLDTVLSHGRPVVLEFYSNYCIACLGAKPGFDELAREFRGRASFVRADVQTDNGEALMRRYGVDTVPTFMVFGRDRQLLLQLEGNPGIPVRELRQALKSAAR